MTAAEFTANWPFVAVVAVAVPVIVWAIAHKVKVELGPLRMASEAVSSQVNHVQPGDPTLREIVQGIASRLDVVAAAQTVHGDKLDMVVDRVGVLERLDRNTQVMFEEFQHQLDSTQVSAARAAAIAKEALSDARPARPVRQARKKAS